MNKLCAYYICIFQRSKFFEWPLIVCSKKIRNKYVKISNRYLLTWDESLFLSDTERYELWSRLCSIVIEFLAVQACVRRRHLFFKQAIADSCQRVFQPVVATVFRLRSCSCGRHWFEGRRRIRSFTNVVQRLGAGHVVPVTIIHFHLYTIFFVSCRFSWKYKFIL